MKDNEKTTNSVEIDFGTAPEQLSYICEYCGKVNPIAAAKCLRCGKRRPRSEYLKVMSKAKEQTSIREETVQEMARIEDEKKTAREQELVRLVEERVAEEKAKIEARAEVKLEQDREVIKKYTARDAVERVLEAEKKASEEIQRRERESEERLEAERERVLYAAAQKVVTERAGIEQAAEERINLSRAEFEKKANRTIAAAVDVAERDAARRAAMKVIASEQSAEDRIRLEREASQRSAFDRIKEESERVARYEAAKYEAQLDGVRRAVEERIKAEREYMEAQLGSAATPQTVGGQFPPAPVPQTVNPYVQQQPTTVQPLAIVPYLNDKQPVYQYKPQQTNRRLYKFVPDPIVEQPEEEEIVFTPAPKKKPGAAGRVLAILSLLATLGLLYFAVFRNFSGKDSFLKQILADGLTAVTSTEGIMLAVLTVLAVAYVVMCIVWLAKGNGAKGGWVVPVLQFADIAGMFAVIGFARGENGFAFLDMVYLLGLVFLILVFALIHYIGYADRRK